MSTDRLRLQPLLIIDAATCAATAALLLVASDPVAALTQLPAAVLVGAGAVLVPIAVFMRSSRGPTKSAQAVTWRGLDAGAT